MTVIDIFSGFLGAGKTTLIKKLLQEAYSGQKIVLIENEFGEIGIDGGFMADAGVTVNEMNSGCICCSLTGDFRKALQLVTEQYAPDRILIEPSGVGKLSEVVSAVLSAGLADAQIGALTAVVDASRAVTYLKNFGEFFLDQIVSANCIVLSRTGGMKEEKLAKAEALIREKNPDAVIVTTPWDAMDGKAILDAMEQKNTLSAELEALLAEHDEECDDPDCCCHHHHHEDEEHEHHHHHHDEDGEHEHHHHHDEDEEHEHHHHHDEDEEHEHHHHHDENGEHEHHHHHDEDEEHEHHHHHHDEDGEHEHHHHHHHGHDADEVFQSWGTETARKFSREEITQLLAALEDSERFGFVIRAKGYVPTPEGPWLHFDYTPGEADIREGAANVTGRLCVIGAGLKESAVKELFRLG